MKKQKLKNPKKRNLYAEQLILRTGNHSGAHENREHELRKGRRRKPKHRKSPLETEGF